MTQVVGLLQRGRKYGVIHFEGETLFQGRDNMTPVFLVRFRKYQGFTILDIVGSSTVEEVRSVFKQKDKADKFSWGVIGEKEEEKG